MDANGWIVDRSWPDAAGCHAAPHFPHQAPDAFLHRRLHANHMPFATS
jgi:hypothetical protein